MTCLANYRFCVNILISILFLIAMKSHADISCDRYTRSHFIAEENIEIEEHRENYVRIGQSWYLNSDSQHGLLLVHPTKIIIENLGEFQSESEIMSILCQMTGVENKNINVQNIISIAERSYYTADFLSCDNIMDIIDTLSSCSQLRIGANVASRCYLSPNDPVSGENNYWHLVNIEATKAWDISSGSSVVRIGVIDRGVDETHVTDNMTGDILNYDSNVDYDWVSDDSYPWPERSFFREYINNNPYYFYSDNPHGTACIGIIGARSNNNRGITGVAGGNNASSGVTVTMHRAIYPDEVADAIEALSDPNDGNVRVISMSIGWDVSVWNNFSSATKNLVIDALNTARSRNVLIVASSGNDNNTNIVYPAALSTTIAVGSNGSIDNTDERSSFSNYGTTLDIVAPGYNIATTDLTGMDGSYDLGYNYTTRESRTEFGKIPGEQSVYRTWYNYCHNWDSDPETTNDDYTRRFSGTSASAPVIAGVLGLIYSVNSSLTDEQAMEILLKTTDKVNPNSSYSYTENGPRSYGEWDDEMGYGRVNAYKAVLAAMASGSHTITENLTFYENFTVRSGVNLTVASGVTLKFASGAALIVEGNLTANGVTFTNITGVTAPGQYWNGISTSGNGSISLTNCIVERAANGIHVSGGSGYSPTVNITGGEVRYNYLNGIRIYNTSGTCLLQNMRVHQNGNSSVDPQFNGIGIDLSWATNVTVGSTGNTWMLTRSESNYGAGIKVYGGSPTIRNMKIRNNGGMGVILQCSNADVYYCNIYENNKHSIWTYVNDPDIDACWLYGTTNTVSPYQSEIWVTDGSSPYLANNNINTVFYYEDGPQRQTSWQAVDAVHIADQPTPTIAAYNCWWGKPEYDITWSDIINQPSWLYDSNPQICPNRTNYARPSRSSEEHVIDPAIIAYNEALSSSHTGDMNRSEAQFQAILREHPQSQMSGRALNALHRCMIRSGDSRSSVEAVLNSVLEADAGTFHETVSECARSLSRQSLIHYQDYAAALAAYRSAARNESRSSYERCADYLTVAWLAHHLNDVAALEEARTAIMASGTDSYEAKLLTHILGEGTTVTPSQPESDTTTVTISGLQASPNPFNPTTTLRYSVDAPGNVQMGVYNTTGQLVRTLVNREAVAGTHSVVWNGCDDSGRRVASGIYLIRLVTPTQTHTTRVTMVY